MSKPKEKEAHKAQEERLKADPEKNTIERWGNEALWTAAAFNSYDGRSLQAWYVYLGKRRR